MGRISNPSSSAGRIGNPSYWGAGDPSDGTEAADGAAEQENRRADLRHALTQQGLHKIELWTGRHGVATADWPAEPVDPFFNVNTPADAAEADRLAAQYAET